LHLLFLNKLSMVLLSLSWNNDNIFPVLSLMGLSFLLWLNLPDSQVVGWPPLRTYRVNSYNIHAKSTEAFDSVTEKSKGNNTVVRKSADNGNDYNINAKEKRQLRSSLFVKVNMDGIPIGRKVDLSAHSSYETLAQTLEDMFNESTTVTTCKGEFTSCCSFYS